MQEHPLAAQDVWATPSPQHGAAFVTPSPGPPAVAPPAISRPHAPARGGGRGARHPNPNGVPGHAPCIPRYAHSGGGGGGAASSAGFDGGGGSRGGGGGTGGGGAYGGAGAPGAAAGNGQRWKFLDEGKLRKVSGKLFPEATPPAQAQAARRAPRARALPVGRRPAGRAARGACVAGFACCGRRARRPGTCDAC